MMDRLIRRSEVEALAGFRSSRIYEMIREEKFPRPTRIGGAARWSLREVQSWVDERLAERDQPQISR
jgi:predicted DNA-binding transcriptional regulator AlpA